MPERGSSTRLAFVVTGRVQGVGFRAATCRAADEHGVCGFVRNRADGAVAGEAQGEASALAAFVAWLRAGPRFARVDDVETRPLPVRDDDGGFGVRP